MDAVTLGEVLVLTKDIYDDGADHHPPRYIAHAGDVVVVREIAHNGKGGERIRVSHEGVKDALFLVCSHEFELKK